MLARIAQTYKEEKRSLILIMMLFLFLAFISWNRCGQLITYDSTREFIVPYLISKGSILYKEVEYFYCPLIPYLLGFLIKLFGTNLWVIYCFGLGLSLIYSLVIYFLSRIFLDKYASTIATMLFLVQNVFFDLGVYVFPYSYSALLGSLLITLMVYLLILHKRDGDEKYIYAALLIISLCSITKQDYFLASVGIFFIYSIILLVVSKSVKGYKWAVSKIRFSYLMVLITIPTIVYSILLQTVGVEKLYTSLVPTNYLNTKASYMFNDSLHYYPTFENILLVKGYALLSLGFCLMSIGIIYLLICFKYKIKDKYPKSYRILYLISGCLAFLALSLPIINSESILIIVFNWLIQSSKMLYSGINIWIIILVMSLILLKEYKIDVSMLFLGLCCLIMNVKMFFDMSLHIYAFFYLPLSIILFVVMLYKYLPRVLEGIKLYRSEYIKASINVFLVCLVLFYGFMDTLMFIQKHYIVNTPIGTHYAISRFEQSKYRLMLKVAKFVEMNSNTEDKILAYPYIGCIYAFANRLPLNNFYIIFPGMIYSKSFEDRFLEAIKKGGPKFILISKDLYDDTFPNTNINIFTSGSFKPGIIDWLKGNYLLITKEECIREGKTWYIEVYKQKTDIKPTLEF